jgi:hypothetical protein
VTDPATSPEPARPNVVLLYKHWVHAERLDRLGAVDGGPVPQHQRLARPVPQQVPEEVHHIGAAPGVPPRGQQQLSK